MASGPITSWEIDGETVESVSDFIFLGSKIMQMVIAARKLKDTCTLEEKLWQTRQCIKKRRHYFADKGPSSQSYGFSSSQVWMWELDHKEGWVPKNDAFELWCWRRLLRVPWATRRSNQSILFRISLNIHCKDWCWSWRSCPLATWYKEPSHWKRPWCWERLKAGEAGNGGLDGWMTSPTQWTKVWASSGKQWKTGKPGVLQSIE